MKPLRATGVQFWLITAVTILGMATTAALGRWQLSRAAQKEALAAAIDARGQEPELAAASLLTHEDPAVLLHRRVEARGEWIADRTVYLDNRQMNGQPGFFVVTPLRLEGRGEVVLVERGWVPRNFEDRTRLPPVRTPAGPVEVRGRIALGPSKLFEFGRPGTGAIRQNLDLDAFRRETSLPLATLTIQQTGEPSDGLLRDWPKINTGVERHYGYAFQWFGLCALMAFLYVWFQIVRRFKRRAA